MLDPVRISPLLFFLFLLFSCSQSKNTGGEQSNQKLKNSVLRDLGHIDHSYITAIQGIKHDMPLVGYFFENVNEIPGFTKSVCHSIVSSRSDFQAIYYYSYQMLGSGAGGYGPLLPGSRQPKTVQNQEGINGFFEQTGAELIHKEEWEKLPFSFKKGIVEILYSLIEAKLVFEQFSSPVKEYLGEKSAFSTQEIYNELIIPWKERELKEFAAIDLIDQADVKKLSFASRITTEKLKWFFGQKELKIPEDFTGCSIKTSLGELLISGTDNDTVKGNYFFVLELGGDDVYLANTASPISSRQPISIIVDLEGNDRYLCDDHFLVAGILGIAVLLDMEGDDFYRSNKPGLAFSLYGSSLMCDYSGDDTYISKSNNSQAAAFVGSAIFIDIAGKDTYHCQSYSQAFGGTLGVGIFIDHTGSDCYNAVAIDGLESNYTQNFIQGAAKGRWAEATDGQSLAGGIGLFIDNSGMDRYNAGSFSQGASYYFGLGIFCDNEGDDEYNAISHSQGYGAHYSLAGFFEENGDDKYNTQSDHQIITQITGGGRDYSAGLFMDASGDDIYHFGNRSAGIGDVNGIGLLADFQGNDTYIWHKNNLNQGSPSLGKQIGLQKGLNNHSVVFKPNKIVHKGIFLDVNGANEFKNR